MMTPAAREIIRNVAAARGVPIAELIGVCRKLRVVHARIEVTHLLRARGYSSKKIGTCLNKDHTTILFYLGRGKKRPSTRWTPIKYVAKRGLVPYAGARVNR